MGGFFGVTSKRDCVEDVFFGVDYHSHLGAYRGGICSLSKENGFQREIHNIENSPFRTKFENTTSLMNGNAAIGCISDTDPQPILIRSRLGLYSIITVGLVSNASELVNEFLTIGGAHLEAMGSGKINTTELVASLINQKNDFTEGILYAHEKIQGSISIVILNEDGTIIAARDKLGRLPVLIGKDDDGFCVSFESFAYQKMGYSDYKELGPGEIVAVTPNGVSVLSQKRDKMRMCAFLFTYYGYPTSYYEGRSVEAMRNKNGEILAAEDIKYGLTDNIDYVAGVPDSGLAYAIGYANKSGIPYARPFIKYTPTWPRSFMPKVQSERNKIAKMKLIPVRDFIDNKNLLFVDDSIVRGTQLRETVDFLYSNKAKNVHVRSSCPPIMYSCKYLNFSRNTSDMDLITRRTILELEGEKGFEHLAEYSDKTSERGKKMRSNICSKLDIASIEYQTQQGVESSIGLDSCKLCTYCWDGKE